MKISDQLYVSSPEFCLLQLSCSLDPLELLLLVYELCGRYRLRSSGEQGYYSNAQPYIREGVLESMLEEMRGTYGTKQLQKVLPGLLHGCASPMEAIVAARVSLPVAQGGYKIRGAKSNGEVRLGKRAAKMAGYSAFHCDLYWPDKNVGLEYDSKEYHGNQEQAAYDAERKEIIEFDGGRVIQVTPAIERNVLRFDASMARLMKALGLRYRKPDSKQLAAKGKLRAELFRAEDAIRALTEPPRGHSAKND